MTDYGKYLILMNKYKVKISMITARYGGRMNMDQERMAVIEAIETALKVSGERDFENILKKDKDFFEEVLIDTLQNYKYKESYDMKGNKIKEFIDDEIEIDDLINDYEITEEDAYIDNLMVATDNAILPKDDEEDLLTSIM